MTNGPSPASKFAAFRASACQLLIALVTFSSFAAAQTDNHTPPAGSESGASAVWIFANLSFTAMRAQATGSMFWKVVTFIFGFPGTLLTLIVVPSGSQRAYGIDMPRRP